MMEDKQRKKDLKKARTVQVFNIFYDLTEVVVSLTAGFISGSSALIGWGLDSVIEVISGSTLWWRLNGELKGIDKQQVQKRKKITLYVISSSFFLVSSFILYDAVTKLVNHEKPDWSTPGVIILIVSLVVNPFLIYFKNKYGNKLNSKALKEDAKDTFICLYQTVGVLAGLLLVRWMGWWWADPVAALLIVPYAAYEGWKSFKSARGTNTQ